MLFIGEDFCLQDVHLIFWFILSVVVSLVADYYYDQLGLCDYGSILSKKDS